MNKLQAYHAFWSGFGLTAYDETSVPDTAVLPYITYECTDDDFDNQAAVTANLWFRSSSWAEITAKEMQIADKITRGGIMINYDGGAFWLKKANPWAQRMAEDSDDMIRRIMMNLTVEFID